MIARGPSAPRRRGPLVARFLRARDGASALEFSLVAIPFLLLLLASLELGLIFVANMSLQNATFAAARQIRVGEVAAAGVNKSASTGNLLDLADFKAKVCANMPLTSAADCNANMYIDVRPLNGFNGTLAPSPYVGSTLNTNSFCFYSGVSGSIVEMRTFYLWPVFTPLLLNALINTRGVTAGGSTSSGQWFALNSHEVFRNEPASNSTNTGATC